MRNRVCSVEDEKETVHEAAKGRSLIDTKK